MSESGYDFAFLHANPLFVQGVGMLPKLSVMSEFDEIKKAISQALDEKTEKNQITMIKSVAYSRTFAQLVCT